MSNNVPIYSDLPRQKRPVSDTPLAAWLSVNGMSRFAFAREVGCDPNMVQLWANGRCLPSLVYAFKIDRATRGGVPPASWLGTELGRLTWNNTGRDWDRLDQQRKLIDAKRRVVKVDAT